MGRSPHETGVCGHPRFKSDVETEASSGYLNEMTSVDVIDLYHFKSWAVEIWVMGDGALMRCL